MSSTGPMIWTSSLTKVYRTRGREVRAIHDVSLEVEAGELFGLFGPNGAGKTTLIGILSTLLAPTSGTARVNGFDVERDALAVRGSIGLATSEERSFYGRLTARRNLSFYAMLQNVPRAELADRVDYVLELFGLAEKAEATFQSLSTGQKQRLNMARAVLHDAPILFLDEPTKSMDIETADFVKELVKEELVGRQRKTVIYISHDLYEMDDFCDRVAILAGGEIRAQGTPQVLAEHLPRRATYRVEVEGNIAAIEAQWSQLAVVTKLTEVSRRASSGAFDIELDEDSPDAWAAVLQTVGETGGRLESYRRLGRGSLRDVIKYFSHDSRG